MLFASVISVSLMAVPLKKNSNEKDVLAYWIDSQHMAVQVPGNVIPRSSLTFFLRDQATPAVFNVQLPVLSYNNDWVILNTSALTRAVQKELVDQALVLDVMSGTFLMNRTGIALTGLLDDLFYTDAPLGQSWSKTEVEIKIWSPTARQVTLHVYQSADSPEPVFSEPLRSNDGIWTAHLSRQFSGFYYQLEVRNFFPNLLNYVDAVITDPYSPGLSADGKRTLLIDLDDTSTKPDGWDSYRLPSPVKTIDSVIYESHIRDLTAADKGIPEKFRGKYSGLSQEHSRAVLHLKELKEAGITHLHLLPFNDFQPFRKIRLISRASPTGNGILRMKLPPRLRAFGKMTTTTGGTIRYTGSVPKAATQLTATASPARLNCAK